MGDQNQCHHESKTRRPILTLGGERCPFTNEPLANYRVKERLAQQAAEQNAIRKASRERVEAQCRRRERAQKRREFRQQAEVEQAELDAYYAERRRQKWQQLSAEAAKLGLVPDPNWSEREFVSKLHDAHRERYRREEERRETRRWEELRQFAIEVLHLKPKSYWELDSVRAHLEQCRQEYVQRKHQQAEATRRFKARALERSRLDKEAWCDEWEHIPYIARFATYCRPTNDLWKVGIGNYRGRGKGWVYGSHRNGGRKQPRTWELAAPKKWRRKDQCSKRWNHLFN